ncbi:hypothetical protein VOLCADRAFT_99691 [Volvox carteri f. nagariensis]|uniref:DUF3533 domain-containing protein n=1 Tax=Volvox carteri f. nagariensis TaxID=3068 RepID=D8UIE0_VOLCA|nr:uncharacterized protein VOLCADRAFT_99691 [Volvox carteri f. nagariensis]EFJ40513.1 hypothetical protein VOLCADRAFT_99691 [Volvox carteri f. nagariensis]|eukprot:XP_002958437.1 hypothetical protein VOLCADRAFT_99691 [Volvox carteri f. nagariensis]
MGFLLALHRGLLEPFGAAIGGFRFRTRLSNLHVTVLNCDVVPPATSLNATFAPLLPQLAPVPLATGLLAAAIWNSSNPLYDKLRWENGTCPGTSSTAVPGVGLCGTLEQEAACLASLSNKVLQGGPWAVLYFPSTFTSSYLSWFAGSGIAPQNQRPVSQYVYARGRDYSTCSYLSAIIANTLVPGLSSSLTWGLANNPGVMRGLSPGFLATGISLQQVDLAPVNNFGQHFATYIFCVLLWLGSSFVVVSSYQFKLPSEALLLNPSNHMRARDVVQGVADTTTNTTTNNNNNSLQQQQQQEEEEEVVSLRLVRLSQVARAVLVKALVASVFMFVLVVLLCVVLFALGRGTEQWHLNPGYAMAFGWYMSWSFVSINAVLLHVMGIERFSSISALLLILQLTSASGVLSTDLSNRFFYIGKGLPFFYGVRGFRTIFFGALQDKMYINWLVFTVGAYNVVLGPLGVLLVVHRVWSVPSRAAKQQRGGSAAEGVGEVVLPVAVAGTG